MSNKRKKIFLSLGSNIWDKNLYLNKAIEKISKNPEISFLKESPRYISAAMYYKEQDVFLNSVIEWYTSLTAFELLAFCQKIEKEVWRKKNFRYGPRIIDIDILLYEWEEINSPILTIPHVGIIDRSFVIYPLYDLNPNLKIWRKSLLSIIKNTPNDLKVFTS